MSQDEITSESLATYKVEGLYFQDTETIFLPAKMKDKKSLDSALLIHELYHHVQNLNGADGENACNIDIESPAEKLDVVYLKLVLKDNDFADDTEDAEKQFLMQ
ncbi:MAG: hypothetical protein H8E38_02685 [SAR324 cluster bacterium]|nr:hypothetical protein [SAR324 cluster bacterium]